MQATVLGTAERPLRVAVIGSGPAGFYTADFVLKGKRAAKDAGPPLVTEVDLFDRLPTPFGLVRSGVAPDHQNIKKVTVALERIAAHANFRFIGNVAVGSDVSHEELLAHYDQVVYATGAPTDKRLDIPGEDLAGSHAATTFVGWYNGHPDFIHQQFDFSGKRAVIVGLGNVAMDVARILARQADELVSSDVAGYALDALRTSRLREVVLLGRRGPAQAAFTPREIEDIAELSGVQVLVDGDPTPPPEEGLTGPARQNAEFVYQASRKEPLAGLRHVRLRFLASPVEILGADGRVKAVRVERNELLDGGRRVRSTGQYDVIETDLVFRSIGYRGTALKSVPFDEAAGTIPNDGGRVLTGPGGERVPRVYVCGWIKRGPSGLIGTNKDDAKHTVEVMLEDGARPDLHPPSLPARDALLAVLQTRGSRVVTMADWRRLDELERAQGAKLGKVREKFYTVEAMLAALA